MFTITHGPTMRIKTNLVLSEIPRDEADEPYVRSKRCPDEEKFPLGPNMYQAKSGVNWNLVRWTLSMNRSSDEEKFSLGPNMYQV